jgi:molecular chaperone DnaK
VGYDLGVDLGTTFTAAATLRDGHAEIATLGTRSPTIPSVAFLPADGELLVGEAAARRGAVAPERMAREFKRRMGDPTPIVLGGSPRPATALTAALLAHVVTAVAGEQGGNPDHLIVTCPANWGPFKRDLLGQAVDEAGVRRGGVTIVSEPEAVAAHYAATARVEPGQLVAVYDLGGGTFDAAVLVNTGDGHRVVGEPTGIEQLGGIDFDDAVLAHVAQALIDATGPLDPDEPAVTRALEVLRRACVEAKEALSHDTEVVIPVALPGLHTELRMIRAEFERLIRPTLATTLDGLRRALRSAGVEPVDLTAVLLAGGSSRIPLVAQMVTEELGRPVAVDIHPKHAVALGAARLAARPDARPASPPPPAPALVAPVPGATPAAPVAAAEPVAAPAPVAAVEPVVRARRRGRRLAWVGLAALTVAALAWPTVGTEDGDQRPEARAAAATDEPAGGGGRGAGDAPGASRGSTLDPSVTGDGRDEGGGAREPSSPGASGAGQAPPRGGSSSGGTGSGTGGSTSGGGAPGSADPSPGPGTTTSGPGPTTAPPPPPVVRPWHGVEAGTCLDDISPHPPFNITSVELRSCDTPHGYEVMGVLDNPAQPYPDEVELRLAIAEYCDAWLYAIRTARPDLVLVSNYGLPTQQEWDSGIRRLTCFVGLYGNRLMTGHFVP